MTSTAPDSDKKFDHQTAGLTTKHIDTISISQKGVKRRENQDRFVVKTLMKDAVLAVVADGMGGEAGGDIAARMAVSELENIQDIRQGNELDVLVAVFKNSDNKILQVSSSNAAIENMGTTLTAVFIKNKKVYWVHVGDSRLFVFRKNRLKQITQDQTFARFLFEEGEITKEQLATHYSQHILDQCIGHGECEPEKGSFSLKKNDLLILSTDGLHKVLDHQSIRMILHSEVHIKAKTERLIRKTLEAGGNDDITVLMLHVL